MYMKTARRGGSESVPASGAAEAIDSSQGRAIAAPAPRRIVRLEILLEPIRRSPSDYTRNFSILLLRPQHSLNHHRTCPLRWRRRSFHGYRSSLAIAERNTQNNFAHQRARPVIIFSKRVREFLNGAAIAVLKAPAQGVPQDLSGQMTEELVLFIQQHLPQLGGAVEFLAGGQRPARIDWRTVELFLAPPAGPIKILHRKADRVHQVMARRTRRIDAMLH